MKTFVVLFLLAGLLGPAAVADEMPLQTASAMLVHPPSGMVDRALSWLGVHYRFGGQDEKKGVDCAGLVRRVFGSFAIDLPRTAAAQFSHGWVVERNELQPGDLVFFRNTYKRGISHVGIYIGDGEFVHAASSRRSVSRDRLDTPYFSSRFAGGRRVVQATVMPPLPPEIAAGMP